MATLAVLDANGVSQTVEKPNANGRAAAELSRPVALSNEDLAAIQGIVTALSDNATGADIETVVAALAGLATSADVAAVTASLSDVSTGTKQDTIAGAIRALTGSDYETVAAAAIDQALGATGAAGDLLVSLLIVPATTSPGAVSIRDGAGGSVTVFPGGAGSVTTLHPFTVPLSIRSISGGWSVSTGVDVSVIATGDFT